MYRPPRKNQPPASQAPSAATVRQFDELLGRVNSHLQAGDRNAAIGEYLSWLERNRNSPYAPGINLNLGCLYVDAANFQEALKCFEISKKIPGFRDVSLHNQALALEKVSTPEAAIAHYIAVVGLIQDPQYKVAICNNLGLILERNLRLADAIKYYELSLLISPNQPLAMGHLLTARQKLCRWPLYSALPNISEQQMRDATPALVTLGLVDDPAQQLASSRRSVASLGLKVQRQIDVSHFNHPKIRIAYLSSNLSMHAVSILTAELYELHDRQDFEVYAFCWSPEPQCQMLARIKRAVDHYLPIHELSDAQAGALIRSQQIDVLIDLQGLSRRCRPDIFATRVAPIQITYLGFPGPSSLPNLDYVIADRTVFPEALIPFMDEKPLYVEPCFQINDRKRLAASTRTRAFFNIPEDRFVFGVFNNPLKFREDVFDIWLNILQRVPDSLLWIHTYEEDTRASLRQHVLKRGIAAERVIFAGFVPPADNLARYALVDMILDTYPFNGGTSTSDALWMGAPVVTCCGTSFASRMSTSLLRAAGAGELVTDSLAAYQELAVWYAQHRPELAALRQRLIAGRDSSALFDTPAFVRGLEAKIKELVAATRGQSALS